MPSQFFIIPLANHAGLIELQEYLKTRLPEGTVFQDPALFHVTLVHVPEVGTVDLSGMALPPMPVFGLGGGYLRYFKTPDGWAITLEVSNSPHLTHLQASLFYACQVLGVKPSAFSFPGLYQPHVTLATMPNEPDYFEMPTAIHFEVKGVTLSGAEYVEVKQWPLTLASEQGEMVSEMATVRDCLVVGEFKGEYPVVKTFDDVDIDLLTKDDPDPKYVTLPVGKDNAVSGNGRLYTKEFVDMLEQAIFDKRPTGIRGHLKDADRATEYPMPVTYWIGARRVGELLWAKAYIPPGENRDMVTRLQGARSKIGTSIYGTGDYEWNRERGLMEMRHETFNLESMDIGPPDRIGIKDLAVIPQVTSEMSSNGNKGLGQQSEDEEKIIMGDEKETTVGVDKHQVIRELTASDAEFLPKLVQESIVKASAPAKVVAEMATVLEVDADKVLDTVRELVNERNALKKARLAEMVTKEVEANVLANAKQVTDGVKATRTLVVELVNAQAPTDEDGIKKVVAEIIGRDYVKAMIENTVVKEMGPAQGDAHGADKGEGKDKPKYFEIPTEDDEKVTA
jgi:2'-5' RNA ligase